jgi:hypothetical protein
MRRGLVGLLLVMALVVSVRAAQTNDAPRPKSLLPGLQLAPVPEILYAQLPQLPRGQGVVVKQIGPDIPSGLSNLLRYDVLLSYDGEPLRDVDQLNRLAVTSKPDQKAPLVLLRAGKAMTYEVALNPRNPATVAKGVLKPGGPPAVAIECTFLDGGKMQIVLDYYSEMNSKLERLTCNGSLPEIEQQVRDYQLPNRVQELVDVALKRLRMANPR